MRARDPRNQGRAIAFFWNVNHPRAKSARNGLTAICAAIIGDQHFARHTASRQIAHRFLDAGCEGFRLIQAGHEDGELKGGSPLIHSCFHLRYVCACHYVSAAWILGREAGAAPEGPSVPTE